jgi:iron(III) transport system ATP-binding protein
MSEIKLISITKKWGEVTAVNNFSATIKDGEFVSILGPSGCGKTTMLRMVAGFEKATDGEIYIGDTLVSASKNSKLTSFVPPEKRGIGMVFQSYAVWPHMNVFNNVAYPLKIKKLSKSVIREKTLRALELTHLSEYEERFPSQLSGGQQQRVALARALVTEPKLLLLDEPLSNLDAKLRESMRFEIKELQKKLKMTIIYVTHDQTEAMAMSDKIIVMQNGIIQQIDEPTKIYDNPANKVVADFIGLVNFLPAEITDDEVCMTTIDYKIGRNSSFTGKGLAALRPENITLTMQDTGLKGKIISKTYLGDSLDYRIQVKSEIMRVIEKGVVLNVQFNEGDIVNISFNKIMVFPL